MLLKLSAGKFLHAPRPGTAVLATAKDALTLQQQNTAGVVAGRLVPASEAC